MTTFTITVQDQAVKAVLKRLSERSTDMREILDNIGTGMVERTQARFSTSTTPDGKPWEPYPTGGATLRMLASRIGSSKSNRKKDGSLNAKGNKQFQNKKLLISSSHLKDSIHKLATRDTLTISSSQQYAAIHQFGGKTGANSWIPNKKIPARPFLPIKLDGTLYPQEQSEILKALNAYLMDGLGT